MKETGLKKLTKKEIESIKPKWCNPPEFKF